MIKIYWNNRVLERIDGIGTPYEETNLYIVEVFYDDDGTLIGWTEREEIWGESLEALRQSLTWMMEALDKPVLIEADLLRQADEARAKGEEDLFPMARASPEELLTLDEVLDSLGLERNDLEILEDDGGLL